MEKITQALIDPKWKWGKVIIDGKTLLFLMLVHPVHGEIVSLIPKDTMLQMSKDFAGLVNGM